MTSKQPPEDLQSLKQFHAQQRAALRALKSFLNGLHPTDIKRNEVSLGHVESFLHNADTAVMTILAEAFGAELPAEGLQEEEQ